MRPCSMRMRPALPISHSIFGSRSSASHIQAPYTCLSACARGDQTAGPRLRLSSLNWMPVASIARPMMPPSASISRTRWPFAVPPIAGLHGICATVSFVSVHNPTWTPIRAAAYAASHPACPAPITMTSKSRLLMSPSLADAESGEDVGEQIVSRAAAADFFERRARIGKIREHELLRQGCIGRDGVARPGQRAVGAVDERDMPYVRDRRAVARQVDVERGGDGATQHVEPDTG